PDALSTTVKVRITDASDATVTDASDATFTILAGFTLSSPNGGEVWTVGSSQNITWTTGGSVPNVKLEYSTDGGSTYPNVIIASTPNTGTFGWTVPNNISATVRVRVSDVNNSDAFRASNTNFKIRGAFGVTAPNGGEVWTVAASRTITWTTTGTIPNVKLEYSKDNFATATVIAASTSNTGSYTWTVPNDISATVKVRVADAADSTVNDVSDANFKILAAFAVSSPNGGEIWAVGATQAITWTTTGTVPNVKLEFSTDGGVTYPNVVAASAANTGSFSWTIPDNISNTVRVRVSDVTDASTNDISDANFKIRGNLTVSAPNGGDV